MIIDPDPPGTPHHYHPSIVSVYVHIQDVFLGGRVHVQRLVAFVRSFPGLGDTQCNYSSSERLQVYRDVGL